MKTKTVLICLLLAVINVTAFGQEQDSDATILEEKIGGIRLKILKNACRVFDYKNTEQIDKLKTITYSKTLTFHTSLKNDTTSMANTAKSLAGILGNVPDPNSQKYKKNKDDYLQAVGRYLLQVQKGCESKDTSWVKEIREEINKLLDEWKCFDSCKKKNEYSCYTDNYGEKGLFSMFVPNVQAEKTTSGNNNGGVQSKSPSNPNELCPRCGQPKDQCSCGGRNSKERNIVFFVLIVLVLLFGGGCIYYRKKSQTHKKMGKNSRPESPIMPKQHIVTNQDISSKEQNDNPQKDAIPQPQTPEKTSPNIHDVNISDGKWIIVGASVRGNGHIQSDMPCQDNHRFESIGDGWGIAIVSDGAGSAAHSELGSKVVVERGMTHFKNLIEKEEWMKNNVLPTDVEWLQKSYYVLKAIRDDVVMVSKKNNVEVKSLSATCLAVIYSPLGLLAAHVGDGRMGYKSVKGEWKAMMTPHKGEEANQTIFIVSDFWSIPNYVLSDVLVPESIVVREPVKAFALMSDGCENTAWKCTTLDQETGKYYDQNKPFEGFFNPLEETLVSFQAQKVPSQEQQAKWSKFIESGTDGFVREQDDKTMIYGYCCTQQEVDDNIEKTKASLN